jgi:hypothetical protein
MAANAENTGKMGQKRNIFGKNPQISVETGDLPLTKAA